MKSPSRWLVATSSFTVVDRRPGAPSRWWPPAPALAAEAAAVPVDPSVLRWGFVSAAAVRGLSALGAGYAVAQVGTAALGALAEKPDLFGRVLVMVGLAEGIAIYGLIVSILILNRLG